MPVCELCGSSDFTKQDGLFVCGKCGTKYTPEEAKKLSQESETDASLGETMVQGVVDAIAALAEALHTAEDYQPEAVGACVATDVRGVNNYIAQGWQMVIADYKKIEHPTKKQLERIVEKAKESLVALDSAAMVEPEKYVQNSLIYTNCEEIVDSVEHLACYEQQDGEWKKVSFPVSSSDLKIPGQKDSWKEKRRVHEASIEAEYWGAHDAEAALVQELRAQADGLEAQLKDLKAEKKSKGFFNFSEKSEVKERMTPVKKQLAQIRGQIRNIEGAAEDYVEERVEELGKHFIILDF